MDKQEFKWHSRWMDMAKTVSHWSKDPSTKVGAIIVRPNNTFVSEGYNGFPRGMDDHIRFYLDRDMKYSRMIHAETNALLFANESLEGYTLYTYPLPPCDRCAVNIIQSGIKKVVARSQGSAVFGVQLRWQDSFDLAQDYFKEVGVEFIRWP